MSDELPPDHLPPHILPRGASEQASRKRQPYQALPCPICGGDSFQWGTLGSQGPAAFKPKGNLISTTRVNARACETCGHVALFLELRT